MSAGVATLLQTTGTPASVSAYPCSRVHDFPLQLYRRSAAWFSRKQTVHMGRTQSYGSVQSCVLGFCFCLGFFFVVVVLCYLSIEIEIFGVSHGRMFTSVRTAV